jgi:D-sedoheptulose 7-phosphate isomerase
LKKIIEAYSSKLSEALAACDPSKFEELRNELERVWKRNAQVFLCGNGGSAANADHAANDLVYGLSPNGRGVNAHSLCANFSVNSCAANDTGYENIFAHQLRVMGKPQDLLICFSGSGNSENILLAIKAAKELGIVTAGVLGFTGGKAKGILDIPIHFSIDDMQIAEDLQMMIIHMLVQSMKVS